MEVLWITRYLMQYLPNRCWFFIAFREIIPLNIVQLITQQLVFNFERCRGIFHVNLNETKSILQYLHKLHWFWVWYFMTSDTVWHGLKNIFYGLNNWKKKNLISWVFFDGGGWRFTSNFKIWLNNSIRITLIVLWRLKASWFRKKSQRNWKD